MRRHLGDTTPHLADAIALVREWLDDDKQLPIPGGTEWGALLYNALTMVTDAAEQHTSRPAPRAGDHVTITNPAHPYAGQTGWLIPNDHSPADTTHVLVVSSLGLITVNPSDCAAT